MPQLDFKILTIKNFGTVTKIDTNTTPLCMKSWKSQVSIFLHEETKNRDTLLLSIAVARVCTLRKFQAPHIFIFTDAITVGDWKFETLLGNIYIFILFHFSKESVCTRPSPHHKTRARFFYFSVRITQRSENLAFRRKTHPAVDPTRNLSSNGNPFQISKLDFLFVFLLWGSEAGGESTESTPFFPSFYTKASFSISSR